MEKKIYVSPRSEINQLGPKGIMKDLLTASLPGHMGAPKRPVSTGDSGDSVQVF